jgi:feruloyl esterase
MGGFNLQIQNILRIMLVLFIGMAIPSNTALAQPSDPTIDFDLNAKCELLEDLKLDDTYILSASIVPAEGDLPAHCYVFGYVLPAINFEIRLPLQKWNGKFFMQGCGGFCGYLYFDDDLRTALKKGYAISTMDSGHWGESVWDCRWAYNNRIAEIDWAYRAVHETARVSKQVINNFYGHQPRISYFLGCSTGGRMALMEAWRYPEDFDGIISNAPVMDNSGLYISYHWAARKNIGADGKDIISPADLELIINSVYQACDSLDGRKDGIIEDPRLCNFDPERLRCDENQSEGCLTAEQVEVLKAWYGGPKNSSGEQLYPGGIPLGSEPFWPIWIIGETENSDDNVIGQASLEFFRYVAFQEDPGENYGKIILIWKHSGQETESC